MRTGQVPPRLAAQLLALSDERDQWERLAVAWARSSYQRGYRNGYDTGYEAGGAESERAWRTLADRILRGINDPTFAELEQRRWGPGGSKHFGAPRPGDYKGGPVAWDGRQQ